MVIVGQLVFSACVLVMLIEFTFLFLLQSFTLSFARIFEEDEEVPNEGALHSQRRRSARL